ncbi:hypothetical protein CR158_17815 [Halomonas heilongjiangensis]|uniref:Microcin J25-processing protein McjB C-terminal domain-containing protein n=1 Tax=Halomonas heilongjiangensis TaxID=1387883 RepID=A0A2N7TUM4_9GAMM|nr:hypothetical protein C1H66_01135 [Halomonas heilongjiangensis]PXX87660.1 hypothetical protein CR158_17815 [Halomonas heilongjiangensis]
MGLPLAWLLVRLMPFRFWSTWLGEAAPGEADPPATPETQAAYDVGWAVRTTNRTVGGRYTCLMQAMAAQWMLSRRHVPTSLVLGTLTERGEDNQLVIKAHAWLKVNGRTVLGDTGERFTAVSSYVRRHPQPVED